jgi:hypothetical protein
MAGQLSAFGYSLTDEPVEADLWLINTYLPLIFLIDSLFYIYIVYTPSLVQSLVVIWQHFDFFFVENSHVLILLAYPQILVICIEIL